jgi:ABC-2 type transport system permease protein
MLLSTVSAKAANPMPKHFLTIAGRIIRQIGRDHRTLALIIMVPIVMMTLIGLSFPDKKMLNYIAPALLAVMALFFSFLITGISFLRERSQGTLERLMATPVTRLDIALGYLFGLLVFALIQTSIVFFFTIYVLDVRYYGELWQILIFQLITITGSVNLGIFTSTFARNEFQVIQFIPLIILPQIFLGGILWPVDQMPGYLQWLANALPLTYAVDGMRGIMLEGKGLLDVRLDLAVLMAYTVITSILAAITIRRNAG